MFALFLIAAAQSATGAAAELTDSQIYSARCALVSAMAPDEGQITKNQRSAGMTYFMGKLRAQLPTRSLSTIFTRELILDVADNMDNYRTSCGAELMKVGPEISEMARSINALADEQANALRGN